MKKNNERLTDIIRPEKLGGDLEKKLAPERSSADGATPPRGNAVRSARRLPRGIFWGVAGLVVIFSASVIFYVAEVSQKAGEDFAYNLSRLQSGAGDLKNFDTESAEEKFSGIQTGEAPGGFLSRIGYFFGGAGETLSGFKDFAVSGVALSREIDFLKTQGINLFLNQKGEDLIGSLRNIKGSIENILLAGKKISSASRVMKGSDGLGAEFYLPLSLEASRLQGFVGATLSWLGSEHPGRVVLMFQNPSEMRPAGGFLGSYGVVTVRGGQLDGLDIHDVVDADETLNRKIVPPGPLQLIAKNWGAAGANWFFDFPTSAEKTLELLEASDLYADEGIKFDGAIAVSPKIATDILRLTGLIELPESGLRIDSENFLIELQRQVQLSREKRSTYPKDVLRELAPAILTRVSSLSAEGNNELFVMAEKWIEDRDLMIFFRNKDMESFANYINASGNIYALPSGFNGDYLAIADANIDGGKTDIFVEQNVYLSSQINSEGLVSNHLVIGRKHEGNKAEYSWYKVANQEYVKVFVPPAAQISNFSGGIEKKITPPVNYEKEGYVHDPNVAAAEMSREQVFGYPALTSGKEYGRKVFSTWSRVLAGKSSEMVFDYSHRLPLPPKDGTTYTFVFEKQAGTNRSYKFEINAPVGFRFRENGLPVYTYDFATPKPGDRVPPEASAEAQGGEGMPGRLVLDLTLEEI